MSKQLEPPPASPPSSSSSSSTAETTSFRRRRRRRDDGGGAEKVALSVERASTVRIDMRSETVIARPAFSSRYSRSSRDDGAPP